MRLGLMKIIEMAYDKRISNVRFREAIQRLGKFENMHKGPTKVLYDLHDEAIVKTEHDMILGHTEQT